MSSGVLYVCLSNDVISLHATNIPKPPESSVSDDICDRFRGKGVLSGLDILLSVRPGNTSSSPRLAHLKDLKRLFLL